MVDSNAQADIRGINIDKLAKGFAEEELVLKKLVQVTSTSAREIRWYQKTAGFVAAPTTTGITSSLIDNTDFKTLPVATEQSWTRNTSYVRKYFVESPLLSDEDIKDSDIDILATNIRDLVRAVAYRVDTRIWNVMTESQSPSTINSVTSNAAWDAAAGQDPIEDILEAKMDIRTYGYNADDGGVLFLSPKDEKSLITWLISSKGSSIPMYSSAKLESGKITEILGLSVVVSTIVTADYACVAIPKRAVTWKEFTPLSTAKVEEAGIGTKIRVWEEGAALLTDPKAVALISNTQT